jgi:hypothetical protein
VFQESGLRFQKVAKDGLLGFTGSTVTVRFGLVIYTSGERGETIYAKAA